MSPRKGGRPGAEGKTPRTRPATGKVEEEAVKANEPLPDAHDRNQHLHTTDGGTDLERQLKSTRAEDRKILLAPRPETLQERPHLFPAPFEDGPSEGVGRPQDRPGNRPAR
jgi:hypothetical protein